jgi:BirA family biotin operon repressor/biotin-[acetyl-CoA-carboxylase] ligase
MGVKAIRDITNPFGAPVYYKETLDSTMNEARRLAQDGAVNGTVIAAGYQTRGRGRAGRPWTANPGENVCFTLILHYKTRAVPQALTLRTGLAVAQAVEAFVKLPEMTIQVKWPNDLMLNGKKIAGILTEADIKGDDTRVFIGIGVNLSQRDFPPAYASKASSLLKEGFTRAAEANAGFELIEEILSHLYQTHSAWLSLLIPRLYRLNETVSFVPGAADSGKALSGKLIGIGEAGELLFIPQGETESRAYTTGELRVY